jgi:hypothetical protein
VAVRRSAALSLVRLMMISSGFRVRFACVFLRVRRYRTIDWEFRHMTEPAGGTTPTETDAQMTAAAQARLVSQLEMMVGALWASPARNAIVSLVAAGAAVIVVTAYGQVRLNRWNQPFYDALSRRNLHQFAVQLCGARQK